MMGLMGWMGFEKVDTASDGYRCMLIFFNQLQPSDAYIVLIRLKLVNYFIMCSFDYYLGIGRL